MTNGEKFKEVFGVSQVDEGELYAYVWLPNHDAAEFSIDWWNAEYQEPTTKNDLGVDLISRADVLKLMKDNWHTHNGDWAMQESMDDIRALPSVTPQESRWIPCSEKYEHHIDHTDCIWYGNDSGCPVTCSQYRDGWNDAMDYIFKDGKGYQPYRHDV